MHTPRFANILLTGPCNLRCPDCMGRTLEGRLPTNLYCWPLLGLVDFIAAARVLEIHEVSVSGTNTEPLCYPYLEHLLTALRSALPAARISLHTNGVLLLERQSLVDRFDRVSLSLPSLRRETCLAMTGRAEPLDLTRIAASTAPPLKVSTLLTPHNIDELPELAQALASAGVRRWVLRQRSGDPTPWPLHSPGQVLAGRAPVRWYANNPVYDLDGLELTVWNFDRTQIACLNLLSDGTTATHYQLRHVSSPGKPPGGLERVWR